MGEKSKFKKDFLFFNYAGVAEWLTRWSREPVSFGMPRFESWSRRLEFEQLLNFVFFVEL
jgi:hypothetical protein